MLFTDIFQEEIEPYYKDELEPLYQFTEKQSYLLSQKVEEYMNERQKKDAKINKDFSNNILTYEKLLSAMKEKELVDLLLSEKTQKFTNRIQSALSGAYEEVLSYQEEGFEENKEILGFDFSKVILKLVFDEKKINLDEMEKLRKISLEEPLRLQIVKDYPGFKNVESFLTAKYSRLSKDDKYSNFLVLIGALGVTFFFPGKKVAKRFFDNTKSIVLNTTRWGLTLGTSYLTYLFAYQSYYKFHSSYKTNMNLALLAVDQRGLLTVTEVESQGWLQNLGASLGLPFVLMFTMFYMTRSLSFSWLGRVSQSKSVFSRSHKTGEYFKRFGLDLKGAFSGKRGSHNFFQGYKPPLSPYANKSFQGMKNSGTYKLSQQFINVMEKYVKPTLQFSIGSLGLAYSRTLGSRFVREKLFQGLLIGTVFLMLSSIQSAIVTPMYQGVAYVLKYIGIDVPVFIQRQLVNVFDDMKRFAFTNASFYLTGDRVNLGHEIRYIDKQKEELLKDDLSEQERVIIESKIQKSKKTIESILRSRIYYWVNYREFRRDYEKFLEVLGFELSLLPLGASSENYHTIRLVYKPQGYDSYSASLRKEEAETMKFGDDHEATSIGVFTIEELLGDYYENFYQNSQKTQTQN